MDDLAAEAVGFPSFAADASASSVHSETDIRPSTGLVDTTGKILTFADQARKHSGFAEFDSRVMCVPDVSDNARNQLREAFSNT
ncbi:hypothetical protein I5535_20045 [Rhodobacteraceae bacterium F11138]|nr:hypothetical protein [Rhodobacteraceae bacterium F11138]